MANGTFISAPCSLAQLLPHSLTIMLVQKLALEPTLTRHSRVSKAGGELARWELGAIYFMLAPAAWEVLRKVGRETAADDRALSGKGWGVGGAHKITAPLAKSQRHLRLI